MTDLMQRLRAISAEHGYEFNDDLEDFLLAFVDLFGGDREIERRRIVKLLRTRGDYRRKLQRSAAAAD